MEDRAVLLPAVDTVEVATAAEVTVDVDEETDAAEVEAALALELEAVVVSAAVDLRVDEPVVATLESGGTAVPELEPPPAARSEQICSASCWTSAFVVSLNDLWIIEE